jgi:hypothetical protein
MHLNGIEALRSLTKRRLAKFKGIKAHRAHRPCVDPIAWSHASTIPTIPLLKGA